jgi:hypothetical protein
VIEKINKFYNDSSKKLIITSENIGKYRSWLYKWYLDLINDKFIDFSQYILENSQTS